MKKLFLLMSLLAAVGLYIGTAFSIEAKAPSNKESRKKWSGSDAIVKFKGYKVERDLSYLDTPTSSSQRLDLYLPKNAKAPVPLVVWIHGGGWRSGDKHSGPFFPFLNGRYAVASINYRLSQEAKFPAQIYDCKKAVLYLKKNSKRFKIDPARIGVWGASAGGHLAALLACTTGSNDLEEGKESPELNSDVKAACDWFGPVDLLTLVKYNRLTKEYEIHPIVKELLGVSGVRLVDAARTASPITYAKKTNPPIFIVHGDKDKLVPLQQSKNFSKRLKELGASVSLKVVSGGHGFPGFGRQTKLAVLDFFDHNL